MLALLIGDQGNLLARVTAGSQMALCTVSRQHPSTDLPGRLALGSLGQVASTPTLREIYRLGPWRKQIFRSEMGLIIFLLLHILEFCLKQMRLTSFLPHPEIKRR